MRTIRVTGKGQIRVKPDTTRITLFLEGLFPEYAETLRRSSEDTERIRDLLRDFGFAGSDLVTLSFNIETEYESYKERGAYRQKFAGYRFRHQMKFDFASDNERLGKILYALANSPVRPEFRLSYTVSDPESVKNRVLGKAVSDAMEKSSVLAQAAGVSLRSIQNIDYSWGEIDFEVKPMGRMITEEVSYKASPAAMGSYDMDIEPDNIEISDTVTVVWEIE